MFSPASPLCYKVDLAKDQEKYKNDDSKFLTTGKLRSVKKLVTVNFSGEIFTSGIAVNEFDGSKSYSIGVCLDEETIPHFETLLKMLEDTVESSDGDWECIDPLKDDEKIYLRCKIDASGKNFKFRSNLKITPNKYSDVASVSTVHFEGEAAAWFNFAQMKCGISFSAKRIDFDLDEEMK